MSKGKEGEVASTQNFLHIFHYPLRTKPQYKVKTRSTIRRPENSQLNAYSEKEAVERLQEFDFGLDVGGLPRDVIELKLDPTIPDVRNQNVETDQPQPFPPPQVHPNVMPVIEAERAHPKRQPKKLQKQRRTPKYHRTTNSRSQKPKQTRPSCNLTSRPDNSVGNLETVNSATDDARLDPPLPASNVSGSTLHGLTRCCKRFSCIPIPSACNWSPRRKVALRRSEAAFVPQVHCEVEAPAETSTNINSTVIVPNKFPSSTTPISELESVWRYCRLPLSVRMSGNDGPGPFSTRRKQRASLNSAFPNQQEQNEVDASTRIFDSQKLRLGSFDFEEQEGYDLRRSASNLMSIGVAVTTALADRPCSRDVTIKKLMVGDHSEENSVCNELVMGEQRLEKSLLGDAVAPNISLYQGDEDDLNAERPYHGLGNDAIPIKMVEHDSELLGTPYVSPELFTAAPSMPINESENLLHRFHLEEETNRWTADDSLDRTQSRSGDPSQVPSSSTKREQQPSSPSGSSDPDNNPTLHDNKQIFYISDHSRPSSSLLRDLSERRSETRHPPMHLVWPPSPSQTNGMKTFPRSILRKSGNTSSRYSSNSPRLSVSWEIGTKPSCIVKQSMADEGVVIPSGRTFIPKSNGSDRQCPGSCFPTYVSPEASPLVHVPSGTPPHLLSHSRRNSSTPSPSSVRPGWIQSGTPHHDSLSRKESQKGKRPSNPTPQSSGSAQDLHQDIDKAIQCYSAPSSQPDTPQSSSSNEPAQPTLEQRTWLSNRRNQLEPEPPSSILSPANTLPAIPKPLSSYVLPLRTRSLPTTSHSGISRFTEHLPPFFSSPNTSSSRIPQPSHDNHHSNPTSQLNSKREYNPLRRKPMSQSTWPPLRVKDSEPTSFIPSTRGMDSSRNVSTVEYPDITSHQLTPETPTRWNERKRSESSSLYSRDTSDGDEEGDDRSSSVVNPQEQDTGED